MKEKYRLKRKQKETKLFLHSAGENSDDARDLYLRKDYFISTLMRSYKC